MSVHSAAHMKCVACDSHASVTEARNEWWICTTCGSYMCPSCRALYLETSQDTCPGTIVRGVESHPPHFTRFLGPRREAEEPWTITHSTVVLLEDVRRPQLPSTKGRVIILEDEDAEQNNETDGQEP